MHDQSDDQPEQQQAPDNFGFSDDEFKTWITSELQDAPGRETYTYVFEGAIEAMVRWRQRYRGNPTLWKRIFKKDRVLKELIESVPIIHEVQTLVSDPEKSYLSNETEKKKKFTIMDLCSGKGYLSMFLSEMLPKENVEKFILVDKAWAMCNTPLQSHHMNWDHIYGIQPHLRRETENEVASEKDETYFTTWPIPLYTAKQDLKRSRNQKQMKLQFFDDGKCR